MAHSQMQVQLSSLIGQSSAGDAAPATAAAAEARTSSSLAPPAGILKHIARNIITEFSKELFKKPHVSGRGPNSRGNAVRRRDLQEVEVCHDSLHRHRIYQLLLKRCMPF